MFWRFILLTVSAVFMLAGCAGLSNPLNSPLVESLGAQLSDLFVAEEKIVFDKEELDTLKAVGRVPLKWKDKLGETQIAAFYVAYQNDALYAADEAGKLVRYDPDTGKKDWEVKTKYKFSGGIGVGDGMVLIGTFKGEVLAYNESGHMLWKAQVTSEILSPPQARNSMVVVRTVDGRIFGLDSLDGNRKWIYQGATPTLTVRSTAGVSVAHGAVFAGFAGGKLTAMSLFNGNIGWEVAVSQPRGVTELERMTDITSAPVVDAQLVCAAAYQGRVACFQVNDGAQIWARESSSSAGLAMDNDYVYVTEDKGTVAAYDKRTGAGMWKQSRLASKKLSAPLVKGHYIIVGDDQGYVNLLRNYDGVVIARSATDGTAILTAPEEIPGGFAVQTVEGSIYAFSTQF